VNAECGVRNAECGVRTDNDPGESEHAWLISLSFWLCLLFAAGLYASASLAPKFLTYLTLRHQCSTNQVRLVTLERQVRYLSKVGDALETEADFAAELARVDFDAARPGDERIPVDRTLNLDARTEPNQALPAVTLPWYTPLVKLLAGGRCVRAATLTAAALLTLFAFTFLHDSQAQQIRAATDTLHSSLRRFVDRYRKSS